MLFCNGGKATKYCKGGRPMLTSKNGETAAHCPIAAAVIRGMKSDPDQEKARVPSNAPFQVGTDAITREVMRSMSPSRKNIRPSVQLDGNKSSQFLMCDYLR